MRTIMKRVLSIVLACAILMGSVPVSAFAADPIEGNAPSSTITEVEGQTPQEDSDDADTPQESPAPSEEDPDTTETPAGDSVTDTEKQISVVADDLVGGVDSAKSTAQETSTQVVETPVSYTTKASDGATILDAAIFCSDVHGSTSDLSSVMKGVKTSGVDYSSIGFVGDTCLTVANTTSIVQSALGDTSIAVMFSYAASHDTEKGADISTNWNYSGEVEGVSDYYLVYTIRETDMQNNTTAETDFTTWYNSLTDAEKKLPIFIMSHRPLHARRSDNANAADWYDAIYAAAESSDIVFFWAHNHTGESSVDTNAYYVAKDGTESFTVYNGSTVVPNFTYMNAGYINANNQDPARINVATTVQITADNLIFQDYTTSGTYSGSYAHNVSVAREFASTVTLTSIDVTGTTEYTLGNDLDLTVTATYSDGSTADVTESATFTPAELSASGKHTVTASYGGMTDTIDVTVNLYDEVLAADGETLLIAVEAFSQGATDLEVAWDDAADVILEEKGLYTDYVVYDLALTNPGETTKYAMALVENMDTSNLAVYHIADDGTLTRVYHTIENDCVVFNTSLTGTFAYGAQKSLEGYTLASISVSDVPKDIFLNGTLDITNAVIELTYSKEGEENYVRNLTVNDSDWSGFSYSGYDAEEPGSYEAVFTFTDGKNTVSTTMAVCVWGETFTSGVVTVELDTTGAEYGVTAVNVSESTNENVSVVIADVIKGDNYAAYDISLTYSENYSATEDKKTVTLPIPESVENPVVYYVSEEGELEKMTVVETDETTVTFETTHFSTYVVGESTEITVPDCETATGSGSITTTTPKTVYVLVSTPTAGNQYIIVSSGSAGTGYALKENTTAGTSVTINAASGSITAPYIETTDKTIMWNATSGLNFQSENGGYYLNYSSSSSGGNNKPGGGSSSYSLSFNTNSASDWAAGTNTLYRNGQNNDYYLRYNSGWTMGSSNSTYNVYFYEKQTVNIESTTTVSGTYSIVGDDLTKVVAEGTTAELSSTLTFTSESGETTTDVSKTATYEIVTVDANGNTVDGDPKDIISKIENGVVTFTGNYGQALVKVSYETDFGTVSNYITVTATEPTYKLDIMSGGTVVTGTTIAEKGVTATTTLQLGTQIQFEDEDGAEIVELPENAEITWNIPEEYHVVATVDQNGLVTFKGVNGAFYVTATLTVNGKDYTAGVNISATTSQYSIPTDGTKDFPEYPNEGAIRFDKTATAVGNFSETGIAQVELSMTGVPYTTGSEIDVVVMLDMTGSMSDNGMEAAELATIAFVEKIVKNEDGAYNNNRVAVYAFNSGSSSPYELVSLDTIASDEELETAKTAIKTASTKQTSGGTPFDEAAQKCHDVLAAAKTDGIGNDRQQFCVFMSDGGPTTYKGSDGYIYYGGNASGDRKITSYIGGYSSSTSSSWTYNMPTEYWTDDMKADGVTVYTVGLLLQTAPSNPSPYSSMTDSTYNSTTDTLTTIGSHYYFTSTILKNMATDTSKYIDIFNVDNASKATAAFEAIALSILQAATDITVEDKITDEYTMVFDIPEGTKDITGVTNDFYIEFLKYTLDEETHERVGTGTSVTKLYLKNTNGVYSAASDTSGTAYAAPVFEQKTIGDKGTLYYWSTNASDGDSGVSVTVGSTTYYFVSYGMEEAGYNMTSGGYANGTVDSATNMSTDLVIATPYFVYNADTRMLYWTVDKIDTTEYALRYFLYLDNSATEVGTTKETNPGSYPTNDHAYITYTNFNGNDCRQEFPKPQLTWSGAQVSYVFYLVNAAGQPINKSGQVVDFANATFITDVYTESTVWNKGADGQITADSKLSIEWLANELLPDEYKVYDENAKYQLHVYGSHTGESIFDYFTIGGSTAAEISSSLNNRLELTTTASTVSVNTTKVYNTKAGTKYSAYGTYTSETTDSINNEIVINGFDFYNTTVAFAVVWQPRLVEDTVVVDYGLDVIINVVQNDILQNTVSGIGVGNSAYGDIAMNTGVSTDAKLGTAALNIDGNTISIENENAIRFKQNDMLFDEPVKFYYETPVEFYEGSNKQEGYMYSSVTVIPATTVYYEDDFVDLKTYTLDSTDADNDGDNTDYIEITGWDVNSVKSSETQAQDRPGKSQISAAIDADNNYGYDAAYSEMSDYSMGNAAMTNVASGKYATATFDFYGTGFDIISLTDKTTGVIVVKVYDAEEYAKNGEKATAVVSETVHNYYGYERVENADGTYTWKTVSGDSSNALYQIPVLKIGDGKTTQALTYDKYTAVIKATYIPVMDKNSSDTGYNFYLDAIRIYNPAGTNENVVKEYLKDNEAYPSYFEVRDRIISKETYDNLNSDSISGVVFIDGNIDGASIADYISYGPNNEVYLTSNNAIAFDLKATANPGEVSKVQIAVKSVGGTGTVEVYGVDADGNKIECLKETISTATDMYYDITALNGKTVVIRNAGNSDNSIISITNIKTTYTAEQTVDTDSEEDETEVASMFMIRRSTANLALATLNAEENDTVTDDTVIETPDTDDTVTDKPVTDKPTDGNTSTGTDSTDKPVVDDTVIDGETDKPVVDDTVKDEDTTGKPVVDDNVTDTPDTDDITSDSTGSESFITIIINAIIAFISKLFGFFGGLFN